MAVIREGNTVTVMCTSSHLTSFAVLVDVGGAQVVHLFVHEITEILSCTHALFMYRLITNR